MKLKCSATSLTVFPPASISAARFIIRLRRGASEHSSERGPDLRPSRDPGHELPGRGAGDDDRAGIDPQSLTRASKRVSGRSVAPHARRTADGGRQRARRGACRRESGRISFPDRIQRKTRSRLISINRLRGAYCAKDPPMMNLVAELQQVNSLGLALPHTPASGCLCRR